MVIEKARLWAKKQLGKGQRVGAGAGGEGRGGARGILNLDPSSNSRSASFCLRDVGQMTISKPCEN